MSSIELTSNRIQVENAKENALKKAARMIGGIVVGHAQELCPVDTGLLHNSITFALGGNPPAISVYTNNGESKTGKKVEKVVGEYSGQAPQDNDGEITVYVGTNVEYAPYNELGTVKMDARPFLRPAMENYQDEIHQIIEQCCKEIG